MSDEIISAIITGTLALLAIGLSVKIHLDGAQDKRRENTTNYWRLWSSEYMRRCRSFAFNLYNEERERIGANGNRIRFAEIKKIRLTPHDPLNATEAIGTVVHFYISLAGMLDHGQIDELLCKNLFAEDARDWWKILEDIDWSGGNTEFYLERGRFAIRRVAELEPKPKRRMPYLRKQE